MNPHIEKAEGHMYYAQHQDRGLTERQIDAALAQAEATLAVVYELQQARQPAPTTEPSHTGAAPVTSGAFQVGDWVALTNSGPEWDGLSGRIREVSATYAHVDFEDMRAEWIKHANLTKAAKPGPTTPRH